MHQCILVETVWPIQYIMMRPYKVSAFPVNVHYDGSLYRNSLAHVKYIMMHPSTHAIFTGYLVTIIYTALCLPLAYVGGKQKNICYKTFKCL